jgi:riboflavin synthase
MFTGLIEIKGRVNSLTVRAGGALLSISAAFDSAIEHGASIAVNGACLTVTHSSSECFEADVAEQTLRRTTLGHLSSGASVNLERALAFGQRVGGHLVTGHVDGIGSVRRVESLGVGRKVEIGIPSELMPHVVERGSIAIDGVSLTVAEVVEEGVVLALIPETLRSTTTGSYTVGTRVNVETDLLAKYVQSCLAGMTPDGGRPDGNDERSSITEERLRELGFLR